MPTKVIFLSIFLAAFSLPVSAQDGEQLFTLYCSACHGADGTGATGGTFPPLAGSDWISGNPKRTIAIVLYGLHGPIEVSGKAYDLEMPPQGAALHDDQIKAILKYVHSAWGNEGKDFGGDLVSTVRAEFADRAVPWTAPELLALFPLDKKETALKNLISRVYKGQWTELPDFNKIQSENVEEEHDGFLKLDIASLALDFGIVWEGDFMAPDDGDYDFFLDADDGARIVINGNNVAELKGTGSMGARSSKVTATLKAGANPIRVEYFQAKGKQDLRVGWKKKSARQYEWLTMETKKPGQAWPSIPLLPSEGKTVIYRNFIKGTSPRAIGFGFPGGLNMVYSADHLAPELVWAGEFLDAGRHWNNRGSGRQPPSSEKVADLTKQRDLPPEARFRGYRLDPSGNPTFVVGIDERTLSDSWKPGETGALVRTLSLTAGGSPLEIPLGNATVAGVESVTVPPGGEITVIYNLK